MRQECRPLIDNMISISGRITKQGAITVSYRMLFEILFSSLVNSVDACKCASMASFPDLFQVLSG